METSFNHLQIVFFNTVNSPIINIDVTFIQISSKVELHIWQDGGWATKWDTWLNVQWEGGPSLYQPPCVLINTFLKPN